MAPASASRALCRSGSSSWRPRAHPTSHHLFFDHFAGPGDQGRFERITKAFEESLEESPHHDDAAADHLPKEEPGGEPPPGAPPFEKLRERVALNSGPLESAVELAEGCW